MKNKIKAIAIVAVGYFVLFVAFRMFVTFSIHGEEIPMTTVYDGKEISGSLYRPVGGDDFPIVVFLHGDGAMDRTANGSFTLFINNFVNSDVAVYSFDKQGVGESEGNWYYQDMEDRALQAIEIAKMLREAYPGHPIGFMGFSQGGWVLSEIALAEADYDYMMLVGGAINWMRQGDYYDANKEIIEEPGPISEEHQVFIDLNKDSDATEGIYAIDKPFLGLFGEYDMNVDAKESYETYKRIFGETGNMDGDVYLIDGANHGLMKYRYENAEYSELKMIELFIAGEDMFADGALDIMTDWLSKWKYLNN